MLYTGLTHAREPLGMMNLFYFVQKLVEGYAEDPELVSTLGKNFILVTQSAEQHHASTKAHTVQM